jgi:hypothetical protein
MVKCSFTNFVLLEIKSVYRDESTFIHPRNMGKLFSAYFNQLSGLKSVHIIPEFFLYTLMNITKHQIKNEKWKHKDEQTTPIQLFLIKILSKYKV